MFTWIKYLICISVLALFIGIVNAENYYDQSVSIVSVTIVGKNLEVIYRQHTSCFTAVYPPCEGHTKIWKEIYKAKGESVCLWKTIEGKLVEEKITSIPEKIEWPEK